MAICFSFGNCILLILFRYCILSHLLVICRNSLYIYANFVHWKPLFSVRCWSFNFIYPILWSYTITLPYAYLESVCLITEVITSQRTKWEKCEIITHVSINHRDILISFTIKITRQNYAKIKRTDNKYF